MKPKELEILYRWTFELQQLRARVRRRSLAESDWLLLDKLLARIEAGEDVRAYFHGHTALEKGTATQRAKAAEKLRKDMEKLVRAAYSLGDEERMSPLPKVARKAGIPLWRVRDITTKQALHAIVLRMYERE